MVATSNQVKQQRKDGQTFFARSVPRLSFALELRQHWPTHSPHGGWSSSDLRKRAPLMVFVLSNTPYSEWVVSLGFRTLSSSSRCFAVVASVQPRDVSLQYKIEDLGCATVQHAFCSPLTCLASRFHQRQPCLGVSNRTHERRSQVSSMHNLEGVRRKHHVLHMAGILDQGSKCSQCIEPAVCAT